MSHWFKVLGVVCLMCAVLGCSEGGPEEQDPGSLSEHEELSDFQEVVLKGEEGKADGRSVFDPNVITSDALFENGSLALTADQVQAFFEETPYGTRCWLADERIDGERAADAVVRASELHGINPLMMLVRMQVEGSMISRTSRPSQSKIDKAFGCGCFDGQSCQRSYRGLERQIECAAETFRKRFDDSVAGTGAWRKGRTRRTLDRLRVTPANHATSSLYAYTPWVLRGRGGNWLVWNITRKFLGHLNLNDPADAFVGTTCSQDDACGFSDEALCLAEVLGTSASICTLACEGFCADRSGFAPTFCTSLDDGINGVCLPQAHSINEQCAGIPGAVAEERTRHVGNSGARASSATVCVPASNL